MVILWRIEIQKGFSMKAEKYLLDYMLQNSISVKQMELETGINIEDIVVKEQELIADDFISLCLYLGVNPDDIMNFVVD